MKVNGKRGAAKQTLFSCTILLLLIFFFSCASAIAETLVPIKVEKGANLIHLTRQFCTSKYHWKEIARINKLSPPYLISPGDIIYAPLELLKTEKLTATVASVIGGVFIVQRGQKLKRVSIGDLIYPGQTLVTEEDGFAHLVFPDNKYTRISSGTNFSITYLVRLADSSLKAQFFLEKGKLTHSVKKQLRVNETFNTRTPVSVTGVRGTEFRMKVPGADSNIVETLKGVVDVEAGGEELKLKKGEGTRVAAGMAPAPPRKLPPTPPVLDIPEIFRVLPVRIKAPAQAADITMYRLRVSTDVEGNNTVLEQLEVPGKNFILLSLADGMYYGHLTSIGLAGFESIPAPPFKFMVRTIPGAPILSSPQNGRQTFDSKVEVAWLQGEDAKSYHIQLATDRDFQEIIEDLINHKSSVVFHSLTPGKYYLRVQAVADDGFTSLYSLVDSWEIKKETTLGTLEGSRDEGLKLRWASMGDDIVYDLQISRNRSFTDIFMSQAGLDNPEFSYKEYIEPDTYYIRVRGVLKDGQASPWTPAQKLTINPAPFGLLDAGVLTIFFLGLIAI